MNDLIISDEEIKLLTEVKVNKGKKLFFPHKLTKNEYPAYSNLWNKILNSSKVDEGVVKRVRSLLPSQAIDVQKTELLQSYNCFSAVLYTLGIEGFQGVMELYDPDKGSLTIPLNGISYFDRDGLEQTGFTQVSDFDKKGSKGLVLLENSMGQRFNHTGVYLGSVNEMRLFFHKPLPCVPDIKPLETLLEASAYAEGRRKRATVSYSYWQLGKTEESNLSIDQALMVFNSEEELKENTKIAKKVDPRADIIDGYDMTPVILYHNNKAIAVVSKCLFNGMLAYSYYVQAPDGRYGEWHEDPEHGDWRQVMEIPKSRLEELKEYNPHTIPEVDVLGKSRKDVEKILYHKKLFSYHLEASTNRVFENHRKLIREADID